MKSRAAPLFGFFGLAVAGVLVMGAWLGCSSKGSPSSTAGSDCHSAPYGCGAGTTCWPSSVDGAGTPVFQCLPSVQGTGLLAPCEDSIGAATCADHMTCDATTRDGQGACTFYCDDQDPCPVSYTCSAVTVGDSAGAPTINICRQSPSVPNQPVDGGVPYVPADASFDSRPNVQT